jgi:hypothetical protein
MASLQIISGGPQSWSRRCGEVTIFYSTGLELRPLCLLTRSQSLYRLRYHCSMQNRLFVLPEFFVNNSLVIKGIMSMLLTCSSLSRLYRSRWVWTSSVRLMLPSPNACLIIAKVSVALFSNFVQNLMLFLCRIRQEIASGRIHDFEEKYVKKKRRRSTSTQLRETLDTDSQDMLVLTSAVESRYYNCCTEPVLIRTLAQWLRHYARSRKVAGLRPGEVNERFQYI